MLTPLQTYFPIGVVLFVAVAQGLLLLTLANVLGPRRPSLVKSAPFECGSLPVGSARERFGVKFYVVALLFIVFDIEAIFLFPWAVLFTELGWAGYVEMGAFVFTLVLGLVYVWKKGVIDWND
ncbi:MAG TPA: NADH-quinone oxidoreductase subunit A [Anaeromyxobacteraceae bacterium]|jgi:NADH-quinone oxidoreductase subunit A|nr:NADH-quinone oxidoreductase subunit A [Anaeromyxobacteraceae bacterium]